MQTNHFTFRLDHHAPILLPAAALAAQMVEEVNEALGLEFA